MARHVLFLTGSLAEPRLRRVLDSLEPLGFQATVVNLGIKVAALMTAEIIRRRLTDLHGADRVMLPGRFRGDLDALAAHFGVPFVRGPEEVGDLPRFLGRGEAAVDLSRHDTQVFAEIVDAPHRPVADIVERGRAFAAAGADVIDLGCIPEVPFPHLEEAVRALRAEGLTVSVDSLDPDDLRRGAHAGARYLLSLTEETLYLADEVQAVPVVIPARPGDLASLYRAVDALRARGRPCIADPILDPVHFGFTASVCRYREVRERYPDLDMLMGVGNVTELTAADTVGMNALLMGMVSELRIGHVLAVQVSPHCRRVLPEIDRARRLFFAAREAGSLPQGFGDDLLCLHDRQPFPDTPAEIAELAAQIRDPNWRIQVSERGIHVYNRDGYHVAHDPFALFPLLNLGAAAGHAFYLGVELARARIAWQLGKRYAQDNEPAWGVAADSRAEDMRHFQPAGSTLAENPSDDK